MRTSKLMSTKFLLSPLFAGLAVACVSKPLLEEQPAPFGKDACLESPIVGSWSSNLPAGDLLTFNSDCSAVSVVCRSRFLFPPNFSKAGVVNIQVIETDGPDGCLSKGTHRCSVVVQTNSATMNCGRGTLQLSRQ